MHQIIQVEKGLLSDMWRDRCKSNYYVLYVEFTDENFPPRQVRELPPQPAYYNHEYPVRSNRQAYINEPAAPLPERQPTSFGEVPVYVRTIPPANRRPVIYLE